MDLFRQENARSWSIIWNLLQVLKNIFKNFSLRWSNRAWNNSSWWFASGGIRLAWVSWYSRPVSCCRNKSTIIFGKKTAIMWPCARDTRSELGCPCHSVARYYISLFTWIWKSKYQYRDPLIGRPNTLAGTVCLVHIWCITWCLGRVSKSKKVDTLAVWYLVGRCQ